MIYVKTAWRLTWRSIPLAAAGDCRIQDRNELMLHQINDDQVLCERRGVPMSKSTWPAITTLIMQFAVLYSTLYFTRAIRAQDLIRNPITTPMLKLNPVPGQIDTTCWS